MTDRIQIEIISADILGLLKQCADEGVTVYDLVQTGDLSFTLALDRKGYVVVNTMLNNRGDTVRIVNRKGIRYKLLRLLGRPVLSIGIFLLVVATCYLPSRVLFVEVTGNAEIPTQLILEEAAGCGIRFGSSRRKVRSEQMKNHLLSAVPDLQWVGINTSGCVAKISVIEKNRAQSSQQYEATVSSIIASRDGVITECVVRNGNLLCAVGQAVKEGQILVSGYTDCGLIIQATCAEAEISADTIRDLQFVSPSECMTRDARNGQSVKISLLFGKKLIKFCKDSGISDAMCDKMYLKKYLTLPGGRSLPVALIVETCTFYENVPAQADPGLVQTLMEKASFDYLSENMVSGRILLADTEFEQFGNRFLLCGRFSCNEIIGQVIHEERIYKDG